MSNRRGRVPTESVLALPPPFREGTPVRPAMNAPPQEEVPSALPGAPAEGAAREDGEREHPRALEPGVLILSVMLSSLGAVIGLQVVTTLGVTPNTAIIGVLVAIGISRIPLRCFQRFRSIHRQNLVQSNVSSATFGAANSLLLPIGIPMLLGMPALVSPMLVGAAMGMLIDLFMLYWLFDSRIFPGRNAWPPGVAAAEAILAGDRGGRRALTLVQGAAVGVAGNLLGVPMSAFGVAFIGNAFALAMFGVGLLLRGYSMPLLNVDLDRLYIPHGMMTGAGLVALVQILRILMKRGAVEATAGADAPTRSGKDFRAGVLKGLVLYVAAAAVLAGLTGLAGQMSAGKVVLWVAYAAVACVLAEFIVGLSAMHAGWFPAFATALIFLLLGMLMGFPPAALGVLAGFVASGGPAFADGGYDLKGGHALRAGNSREFEMAGRRQQLVAGLVGLGVASVMVALFHKVYFKADLFPPVDRVFAATIRAGVDPGMVTPLILWAVPGALLQALGGPERQLGILFATGLLILNPMAGWAVLAGLAIRLGVLRLRGKAAEASLTLFGAGCIAGDALHGFFKAVFTTKGGLLGK